MQVSTSIGMMIKNDFFHRRYGNKCLKIHPEPKDNIIKEIQPIVIEEKPAPHSERVVCYHFFRGKCRFGDSCIKSHEV